MPVCEFSIAFASRSATIAGATRRKTSTPPSKTARARDHLSLTTIYTIGHSTRGCAEFNDLLLTYGIELLVDVRQFPGLAPISTLSARAVGRRRCADVGIDYRHEVDLGGRRCGTRLAERYWHMRQLSGLRRLLATIAEFATALERLIAWRCGNASAIMCSEAFLWRCHRSLISDVPVLRGIEVVHATRCPQTVSRTCSIRMPAWTQRAHLTYPDCCRWQRFGDRKLAPRPCRFLSESSLFNGRMTTHSATVPGRSSRAAKSIAIRGSSSTRDEVIRPDGAPGTHCIVRLKAGVSVLPLDDTEWST